MTNIIQKSWGYEEIVHADENYTCKKLVYTRRISSSLHYHPSKHESFVVASGLFAVEKFDDIEMSSEGTLYTLRPGDSVVLPPQTPHRVRCMSPGIIVESSTFDDAADCVRLIPSEE